MKIYLLQKEGYDFSFFASAKVLIFLNIYLLKIYFNTFNSKNKCLVSSKFHYLQKYNIFIMYPSTPVHALCSQTGL